MSTIIQVKCTDQVLTYENTPIIASGGVKEDHIQFTFCEKWDGLTKTAVFWRSEKEVYHVMLDESDGCAVPPEVLASAGVMYFGVFGVSSEGKQRTSEVLRYNVENGAINPVAKPLDPTPDIYTQLMARYDELRHKSVWFSIGDAEPYTDLYTGPAFWFNTSGTVPVDEGEIMLLNLNDDGDGETVQAEIGGESMGVNNATVNKEPTAAGVYDFTIL